MPHKRNGVRVTRRQEGKRERASVRQVLLGGRARQPHRDRWRSRAPRVPML